MKKEKTINELVEEYAKIEKSIEKIDFNKIKSEIEIVNEKIKEINEKIETVKDSEDNDIEANSELESLKKEKRKLCGKKGGFTVAYLRVIEAEKKMDDILSKFSKYPEIGEFLAESIEKQFAEKIEDIDLKLEEKNSERTPEDSSCVDNKEISQLEQDKKELQKKCRDIVDRIKPKDNKIGKVEEAEKALLRQLKQSELNQYKLELQFLDRDIKKLVELEEKVDLPEEKQKEEEDAKNNFEKAKKELAEKGIVTSQTVPELQDINSELYRTFSEFKKADFNVRAICQNYEYDNSEEQKKSLQDAIQKYKDIATKLKGISGYEVSAWHQYLLSQLNEQIDEDNLGIAEIYNDDLLKYKVNNLSSSYKVLKEKDGTLKIKGIKDSLTLINSRRDNFLNGEFDSNMFEPMERFHADVSNVYELLKQSGAKGIDKVSDVYNKLKNIVSLKRVSVFDRIIGKLFRRKYTEVPKQKKFAVESINKDELNEKIRNVQITDEVYKEIAKRNDEERVSIIGGDRSKLRQIKEDLPLKRIKRDELFSKISKLEKEISELDSKYQDSTSYKQSKELLSNNDTAKRMIDLLSKKAMVDTER